MAISQTWSSEDRREPRLEVLHRTYIIQGNGDERAVTIVNVSANGFMARADGAWAEGDMLSVLLPVVGVMDAEVRWVMGGRIGCKLLRTIPFERFTTMLNQMAR